MAENLLGAAARRRSHQPIYFMADQLSLNAAIYLENLPYHILPAEYNWLTLLQLPAFDKTRVAFVRPSLPHTQLSVLHLAGDIKRTPQQTATTVGEPLETLLTYSAYKSLRLQTAR